MVGRPTATTSPSISGRPLLNRTCPRALAARGPERKFQAELDARPKPARRDQAGGARARSRLTAWPTARDAAGSRLYLSAGSTVPETRFVAMAAHEPALAGRHADEGPAWVQGWQSTTRTDATWFRPPLNFQSIKMRGFRLVFLISAVSQEAVGRQAGRSADPARSADADRWVRKAETSGPLEEPASCSASGSRKRRSPPVAALPIADDRA